MRPIVLGRRARRSLSNLSQGLGHASYLIGSEQTGEAFVFDPRWDVEVFFEAARMQGLGIRHALDSHGPQRPTCQA